MEEGQKPDAGRGVIERERGLARQLSARQLAMIAIGGAIGTGLFLGSSLAVNTAGPAVVVTYLLGSVVALLLMGALSEMAVAHPAAGSFGAYAELYLSPWAGFVVRYSYWASQAVAIGGEAVAVAIYLGFWFPLVSMWVWVVAFSAALVYVNARSVGSFGEFEYWFAMVKVVAIVAFIVFGAVALAGLGGAPAIGLRNFTAHGGFFARGMGGAWMAIVFVIFSFIGTEVVAVTAGEAKDPREAVPRAMRSMLGRLVVFYLGAMVVLVGVVPWDQVQPGGDVTASPFVKVFALMGIPAAAHVVNFVVITAALSSMNCNLYLATRMLFSLSRGGYAPAALGRLSSRGAPVNALLLSAAGLLLATLVAVFSDRAYVVLFGVALFGGLFVWLMIFVTHFAFRRQLPADQRAALPVKMIGFPYTTALGAALLLAILATTWWVPGMRVTLIAGLPWLAFLSIAYLIRTRSRPPSARTARSTRSINGTANG